MNAFRIVFLVLALAAVAFAAKSALTGSAAPTDAAAQTAPKRQLDAVRDRATELGRELQRGADRADVQP